MMKEQIKPVGVDKYMNEHGKPTLKKVVSHVRDLDKEIDLSREERIAVLNQAIDKTMQDRYYYTQRQDVKQKREQEELREAHEGKQEQKDEEAEPVSFSKASEVAEEEEEPVEEPEPVEEEEEPEQKEEKAKTLADLLK